MAFIMEPVLTINFIFCMIILVMGYLGFRKLESPLLLYIGIAFGLFGVSHLAQLAGYPSGAVSITGFNSSEDRLHGWAFGYYVLPPGKKTRIEGIIWEEHPNILTVGLQTQAHVF
jgi:hypothetical protein